MFGRTRPRSIHHSTPARWDRASGVALILICITALVVGSAGSRAATAQSGTPVGSPVPGEGCRVAPRLVTAWDGTPAVGVEVPPVTTDGPFVPPIGEAADAGTSDAVRATIAESVACANAGDFPRMLALTSDRFVRALFTGDAAAPEAEIVAAITAPATPVTADQLLTVLTIDQIVVLDDGRVAATVVTRDATTTYTDVVYLVDGGDRWLIDDSVAIDPGTQVGASPAP
ncbi:MAG: hypothetical protein AVDCRST_MAG70-861 [uncultured Thermomicrobiales bacterium]|uniref:DUF4440 domain-containing protein n=1 Tax=uncultured Thermomicrobiales bacterium TaxID=1645740 RepID=A0A6J4UL47_9BACT|nr:MAG: hypothetical protein AVDCRST_MAG70-861 [uncultured Thermomicrobiales bacterium]